MWVKHMREIAEEAFESAVNSDRQGSEAFNVIGAIWSVGAEICERLDRLLEEENGDNRATETKED